VEESFAFNLFFQIFNLLLRRTEDGQSDRKDCWTVGHKDSRTELHLDRRTLGQKDTRTEGHSDRRTLGQNYTRTELHLDRRILGQWSYRRYIDRKILR
jgi:hypothetical protein